MLFDCGSPWLNPGPKPQALNRILCIGPRDAGGAATSPMDGQLIHHHRHQQHQHQHLYQHQHVCLCVYGIIISFLYTFLSR